MLGVPESYADLFTGWRETHREQLRRLRNALARLGSSEAELSSLVSEVKRHYDQYYDEKVRADRQDVVAMLVPAWSTSLEQALMWIGGWRPTAGFHLVQAVAEQRSRTRQDRLSLSAQQAESLAGVRDSVAKQEEGLSSGLARLQQSLGDEPMLSLARGGASVEGAVGDKLKELENIVVQADELRKRTLAQLLAVLSSVQAAEFLLAAGHLDIVVSELGRRRGEYSEPARGLGQCRVEGLGFLEEC